MESRNNEETRAFFETSASKKIALVNNKRVNHFVMIPGCPRHPVRHPGVDDSPHPTNPIPFDQQELITLGKATIETLHNSGNRVCKNILIFSYTEENMRLYRPHLLSTYAKLINEEKQFSFVLHIAGHGDAEKIGSVDPAFRMTMDIFAPMLTTILEVLDKNKPIHIVFHTCNSAYCDLTQNMSEEEVSQCLRENTLIGKFMQEMRACGFHNLTVTGYRGYYCHTKNHRGSLIMDHHIHPSITQVASKGEITILPNNRVNFPSDFQRNLFPVRFASPTVSHQTIIRPANAS